MDSLSESDLRKIIVFYKERPQYVHGSGIISYASKLLLKPNLKGYTKSSTKVLEKFGNTPIIKMEIYRTPVRSMFIKALDVISLGKFKELMKKYGFDKFFHLALVVTLNNNKKIIIQKNEVIEVSPSFKTFDNTEVEHVELYDPNTQLTINQMFANARKVIPDKTWFGYSAFGGNNCQNFIKYILENNGLYGESEKNFIFQDIEKLAKELPNYVNETMNLVSDAAATITDLRGTGKQQKMYIVKNLVY